MTYMPRSSDGGGDSGYVRVCASFFPSVFVFDYRSAGEV